MASTKTSKTTDPLAAAKAAADALAKAELALSDLSQKAEAATEKADEISSSWAAGDETVSAVEGLHADAEARRANMLLEASQRRVTALQRRQINTDLRAAVALIPAVEKALKGRVQAETRIGKLQVGELISEASPKVILTQSEPTIDTLGILSAKDITITFLRDELLSRFPADDFETAARELGHSVEVKARHLGNGLGKDGQTVDVINVQVHAVTEARPVIATDPTDSDTMVWANRVMNDLVSAVRREDSPMRVSGSKINDASGRSMSGKVLSSTVKAGVRSTTVEATINVNPYRSGINVDQVLNAVAARQDGAVAAGLGRCVEVSSQVRLASDHAYGAWNDSRTVKLAATFEAATE